MALKQSIVYKGFEAKDTYVKIENLFSDDYYNELNKKKFRLRLDVMRYRDENKIIKLDPFVMLIDNLGPEDINYPRAYELLNKLLEGSQKWQ